MNANELKTILEKHKKWLINETGGERANLQYANLQGADLQGAYLQYANLRNANLIGTNIDFSVLNLSCKGLDFKIDERILKQIMYHVVNLAQTSKLNTKKIFKKNIYKWLEDSHVVTEHEMPILKENE